jgi:hypothetical protein
MAFVNNVDDARFIESQVQTIPTQAARNAKPTERLEQLAESKRRPDGPFREPEWPVSKKAMKAQSTERTRELSRSKGLVEGFQVDTSLKLQVFINQNSLFLRNQIVPTERLA